MAIKTSERELSNWLCQQINEILHQGGYPFEESTTEVSLTGETSRFPDIAIWINRSAREAFAFIEIKPPGKLEDRSRLPEVAERLKCHFAITWNFSEGELFYIENRNIESKKQYPTYVISDIEEWLRADKKIKLRKHLKDFIDDLKEFHEKGHLHNFPPDKHFFIGLLRDHNAILYEQFVNHLAIAMKNKRIRREIQGFMASQGIPDMPTQESYELLASQWVYGLLTKIIFYLTIKRHFSELPDIALEIESGLTATEAITKCFSEARKIDWQAVYDHEDPIEKIGIPDECEDTLSGLIKKLNEYNFVKLKEDIIGEIFENLIPETERRKLGQYFTREDLVDLIIGFVVNSPDGFYCDPTCGSGTFLNRLYSRIKTLSAHRKKHNQLLSQIWGIDIAKFPAELATIILFRHDISNYRNFPRIKVSDFFDVTPGQEFEFPPPKATPGVFTKEKLNIPDFDGMVGNFPFIRQEQIESKVKGYKKKLTNILLKDWQDEYPDLFKTRNKKPDLNLSGQADIYAYLFIHGAKFIKNEGRMGFISSNSYLDVGYGYELKKFFLRKFKVIAVVASWAEPWFDFASVNTVFTILERCDDAKERQNHAVKFVKIKKKLQDLIPFHDLMNDEERRWNHIDRLIDKIENAGNIKTKSSSKAKIESIHSSIEDDNFRIRIVNQGELSRELEEKREYAKWGKYLRAPDVYFEILEKAKDKLVPLREVAEIRRGFTTGINDFFYLEPTGEKAERNKSINVKNARGWEGDIEERFLKPVIKSPQRSEIYWN